MARRLAQLAGLSVTEIDGIGARHAAALAEAFGVETVLDLLTHYPRSWIDRTNQARIADLEIGEQAMVLVTVRRITARKTRGKRPRALVTGDVADDSGHLKVTFFNQAWRERQLPAGTTAVLWGKVDTYRGQRQMTNPVVDLVGDQTGRIVPVYPQSEKHRLTTWDTARWIAEVLRRAGTFAEPVPAEVLARYELGDRTSAFRSIHQPETMADQAAARRRLVFDELFRIQLTLVLRKRSTEQDAEGIAHQAGTGEATLPGRFLASLPFGLTGAQQRAVAEITRDLASDVPMHRLLQGDVGSGKTVVAVTALLVAIAGGHQGALMAPTEVLAEQHFASIRELVGELAVRDDGESLFGQRPLRIELLTNRTPASTRARLTEDLAAGRIDLVIGTHALISEGVEFASLGMVVVDEQHRFGVEQRAALRSKGSDGATPDVLVMTATPIPRTAAMTVYGDLDETRIDEMPPGRTPIETTWARLPGGDDPASASEEALAAAEAPVWAEVRDVVSDGHQAYVVCPLIEESDKLEARAAEDTFARLTGPGGELEGLAVELLHGRMTSADKEAVMGRFRSGETPVLVATTVIEVGVDVPNATLMVILDADRFGIAQLHQLRGRVGRGDAASRCVLVAAGATPDAEERLGALVRSTDGFDLSEVDLELRGEGTIMGERQKGRTDLKLASLRRDRDWVGRARKAAFELIDDDPDLAGHPDLADELALFLDDDEREYLFKG